MTAPGALTVLGIDPGLTVTGYGVVLADGGAYREVGHGAVALPAKAPHTERLLRIHEAVTAVIQEFRPHEVSVEDFVLGHVRAAVAVGEARAAVLLAAAQAGLPVTLYKPAEVKQFVTSYGRGSKEQVQSMVQALLGLDAPPASPDAADALAVALCHCLRRNNQMSDLQPPTSGVGGGRRAP